MKSLKFLKVLSWSIIVLGCIHLIATPFVMDNFKTYSQTLINTMLFMYVAAGLGTILPGIVVLKIVTAKEFIHSKTLTICFFCSVYLLIYGIMAVITMFGNPFAYIMLILSIAFFLTLLKNKVPFRQKQTE